MDKFLHMGAGYCVSNVNLESYSRKPCIHNPTSAKKAALESRIYKPPAVGQTFLSSASVSWSQRSHLYQHIMFYIDH